MRAMEGTPTEDLSRPELVHDFLGWTGEFDREFQERKTIQGDSEEVDIFDVVEYLIPVVSEETTEFDAQAFEFLRAEQEARSGPIFDYEHEDDLPQDATITPEQLNSFLKRNELERVFTIAGQMIEVLSVQLIMEEVVASSRESSKVRKKVAHKSQYEREWLLHVTGEISDGEKGEIRRVYDLRSSIVHGSETGNDFLNEVNMPSDIDRAKEIVNTLHEKVYGIGLSHRVGNLIT